MSRSSHWRRNFLFIGNAFSLIEITLEEIAGIFGRRFKLCRYIYYSEVAVLIADSHVTEAVPVAYLAAPIASSLARLCTELSVPKHLL